MQTTPHEWLCGSAESSFFPPPVPLRFRDKMDTCDSLLGFCEDVSLMKKDRSLLFRTFEFIAQYRRKQYRRKQYRIPDLRIAQSSKLQAHLRNWVLCDQTDRGCINIALSPAFRVPHTRAHRMQALCLPRSEHPAWAAPPRPCALPDRKRLHFRLATELRMAERQFSRAVILNGNLALGQR